MTPRNKLAGRQFRKGLVTDVSLTLAGLLGTVLFVSFLGLFVNLWIRTGTFSPIQIAVYFGIPSLEVLALIAAILVGRRSKQIRVRSFLTTLWLANVLNLILGGFGIYGF